MKKFLVTARDHGGKRLQRTMYAASEAEARMILERQSIELIEVRAESARFTIAALYCRKRLSPTKLAFLFQQLAAMTVTGITFVQGWRLIQREMPKQYWQTMEETARSMENGTGPSTAMEQAGLFPSLACRIIRAGENSGSMDKMLNLLGEYYDNAGHQKQCVINALAYPAFLIFCTFLLLMGAMFYILPVFEELFRQMAVPLPAATRGLLLLRHLLYNYLWLLAAALLAAAVALVRIVRRPAYRAVLERYILTIKPVRKLGIMYCWQRFSRILAVQLAGGIPLLTALQDASAVVPLLWFQGNVRRLITFLEGGMAFSRAVRAVGFGTPYIETMLRVGETTGNYEEALQALAAYYEWQISLLFKRFRRILEPAVLIIVGLAIGFLVLSLLLPLLDAATTMVH